MNKKLSTLYNELKKEVARVKSPIFDVETAVYGKDNVSLNIYVKVGKAKIGTLRTLSTSDLSCYLGSGNIIQTIIYNDALAMVIHEFNENFSVDGKRVMNPHFTDNNDKLLHNSVEED